MNCDVCDSADATIYLTQIVEGKMQKVNLCDACAKDKGVTDPTGFALADLLEGMGEETVSEAPAPAGELSCPTCGFSQTDFKKSGRFGCADCYTTFSEGLDNLLEAMHRKTQHSGKVPANFEETKAIQDRLSDLRANLEASVAAEDYEKAAALRDAISQLEADAAGGAGEKADQN